MKKILLLCLSLGYYFNSNAQLFWTEDFGTGCSQGTLASGYNGTHGVWTLTSTGTNDTHANEFFISATEAGMGDGNCGDGCLNTGSLTNRTLHLGNVYADLIISTLPADNGASYNSGGVCQGLAVCVATDKRIESPIIDCSDHGNLVVYFNYMEGGDGLNDNVTMWYNDGTNWTLLEDLPKTTTNCSGGQGQWAAHSVDLPLSAWDNPNVQIGFRWVNNDDATGTDPSFAVDDIGVDFTDPTGVQQLSLQQLNIFPNPVEDKAKITFHAFTAGDYSIEFSNAIGQRIITEKIENLSGDFSKTYDLNFLGAGLYFVKLTSPEGRETKKIILQ